MLFCLVLVWRCSGKRGVRVAALQCIAALASVVDPRTTQEFGRNSCAADWLCTPSPLPRYLCWHGVRCCWLLLSIWHALGEVLSNGVKWFFQLLAIPLKQIVWRLGMCENVWKQFKQLYLRINFTLRTQIRNQNLVQVKNITTDNEVWLIADILISFCSVERECANLNRSWSTFRTFQ